MPDHKTSRIVAELERSECGELRLRRGLPLVCGVMCFVSSSLNLAVGSPLKQSDVCSDAMDMAFEISKLIKFSPKRNALLE